MKNKKILLSALCALVLGNLALACTDLLVAGSYQKVSDSCESSGIFSATDQISNVQYNSQGKMTAFNLGSIWHTCNEFKSYCEAASGRSDQVFILGRDRYQFVAPDNGCYAIYQLK